MGVPVFTNQAAGELAFAITGSDTTLVLKTGQGSFFPAPTGGNYALIVVQDEEAWEVMKVTARIGDVLTVTRAQEGTVTHNFPIDAVVEMRVTAGMLAALHDTAYITPKNFGGVGDGVTDAAAAFTAASASGSFVVPRGTFLIGSNIAIAADVRFEMDARLSIASGVTVTFNGDVTGPAQRIFSGLGSAVLAGQKTKVFAEWWGAAANGATNSAAAFQAAHNALTNGGTIQMLNGNYIWESTLAISNKVDLLGLGRGYNPSTGGTRITPTAGMATNGTPQTLIRVSTGSVTFRDFMVVGISTTSRTQNYIAFQAVAGSGKLHWQNLEVIGCGVGYDLVAGNVGEFIGCNVYAYTTAGWRFGGTAGVFSGPWRIKGGIVNNPDVTLVTTAATASGTTLKIPTAGLSTGMGIGGYNIPAGTTITVVDAATVTLSQAVTGAGVGNGVYVRVGWNCAQGRGFHFLGNAFDIYLTDVEQAGGLMMMHIQGSAGLLAPNAIFVQSSNFTASCYYGVLVERGINIQFGANSWIGDVIAGHGVAAIGVAASSDIEGLTLRDMMVGGAGFAGVYLDKVNNVMLDGIQSTGSSLSAPGVYANVQTSASPTGNFSLTNSRIANSLQNGSTGQCSYGLFLNAGSFTGGTVVVTGNRLQGSTASHIDGSAPTGASKVFANNVLA